MTRHVERDLTAYVEGQLSPRRTWRVRQHINHCPACRAKLAQHERLAADLRLALQQGMPLRQHQIEHWWQQIAAAPPPTPSSQRWLASAFAPLLLSLLILVLPIVGGFRQAHVSAATSITALSPIADTTILPPVEAMASYGLPVNTAPAVSSTASAIPVAILHSIATPAPAPRAP